MPGTTSLPVDAVTDIGSWLQETKVLSGTDFFGALVMTKKLNRGDPVLTTDFTAPPYSPPNSLSYVIDPGQVAIARVASRARGGQPADPGG